MLYPQRTARNARCNPVFGLGLGMGALGSQPTLQPGVLKSGYLEWWDWSQGAFSDAGVTPATQGQGVQEWIGHNGTVASQATSATRPTYNPNGSWPQTPGLAFSGSQYFTLPVGFTFNRNSFTILLVQQFNMITGGFPSVLYGEGSGSQFLQVFQSTTHPMQWASYNSATEYDSTVLTGQAASPVIWQCNGTTMNVYYIDQNDSNTVSFPSQACAGGFLGNWSGNNPWNGWISHAVFYNSILGATDTTNLLAWGNAQAQSPLKNTKLVLCDGNSLMVGFGSTVANAPPEQTGLSGWDIRVPALYAQATPQMTAAGKTRVDSLYWRGRQKNVAVCWEGRNDIVNNSASAATAYANILAYVQARQAAGWKVVVGTILPSSGLSDTTRATVNSSITTNAVANGYKVADFAANGTIGPNGANTNATYYQSDQIHMTAAGYAIVGGILATAIGSV